MYACPQPPSTHKTLLFTVCAAVTLRTRPTLHEVLHKGQEPVAAPALQDSAVFCVTEFQVSFASVSNRIRVTPGQLQKLLASKLDVRSKNPNTAQKPKLRVCFLCSAPGELVVFEGFG